jgi:formamidopyrimidine-DNA glycosylase
VRREGAASRWAGGAQLPELPEVETVVRGLRASLAGRRIVGVVQNRLDLRLPLPARLGPRLEGRTLLDVRRRAKFILADLDDANVLILHLGMSGRLRLDGEPADRHEHVIFRFDNGCELRFVDPRRFGIIDLWPAAGLADHPLLRHHGLEPLQPEFSGAALLRLLRGRRTALKTALMDQRLVVGVGNIYASEALFRARVSPSRLSLSVGPVRADRIVAAIREVLVEAITAGGSSLRDYVQADGELGSFQRHFRVYDREAQPCLTCGGPIRRSVIGGRSTYWCPRCQR